jgi:FeS assembly SUF system protein
MSFFSRFRSGSSDSPAADPESPAPEAPAPAATGAPPPDPADPDAEAPAPGWDLSALAPAPAAAPSAATGLTPDLAVTSELKPRVIDALKTVFDPEIPVDIYELGLIYDVQADAARRVHVTMTLTSPACPSAQQLPSEVKYKVLAVEGVSDATVEVVWEPPWDKDRMSDAARLHLGIF